MNIFALDNNPKQAALWHNDKHIVKMQTEAAQMLSMPHNHHLNPGDLPIAPYKSGVPYLTKTGKKVIAHYNHPCSVWVRKSIQNYRWLVELGTYICEEYTHRYGRRHAAQNALEWLRMHEPVLPDVGLTEFEKCVQNPITDPVEAYRECYRTEKKHIAKWTNREVPAWY